MKHTREEIEDLPTLAEGQVADLKIDVDDDNLRVWLNRANGRVEYERLIQGASSTGRPAWRACDHEGNLIK